MISLEPDQRPTFDNILHTSRGTVFPESFYSFLHNYVASINEMPSNPPYTPASTAPPSTNATIKSNVSTSSINPPPPDTNNNALPSDSDHRLERIWADYESIEPYIIQDLPEEGQEMNVKIDYQTLAPLAKPFQVCAFPSLPELITDGCSRTYYQWSYTYQIVIPNYIHYLEEEEPPLKVGCRHHIRTFIV